MDEVAAAAVVEPVVEDPDVSRPVFEMETVREQRQAVAAATKLAAPDRDVPGFDDLEGRAVAGPLRRQEHIAQVDVT